MSIAIEPAPRGAIRRPMVWTGRTMLLLGGLLLIATMFLSIENGCAGITSRIKNWHRPVDDAADLIESIQDAISPRLAPQPPAATNSRSTKALPMPRPPAPLRDHLLPRVGRVFGLWIPTAFVGIFAIIVALGGPQHRCRPLVVAMAIMHAARWPLSTACMWWYDNREQWSSPATWLKLLQFPSGWPSVSACLAPLLLIHGLWMVRRGGNASLTLLFVWGFYFLTTLLTVDPQYRFWPDFLRDPYVNNGQLFGVFTALVGSFLVTLGAAMTALFLARSWLEFAALLLCGKRPRRDQQVCESCGYSLLHLTSPRCPECGTPIGDQIGVSPTPLTPHDPQK